MFILVVLILNHKLKKFKFPNLCNPCASHFETTRNAQRRQIYLSRGIVISNVCSPLLKSLDPVKVLYVQVALGYKKLYERMHQQVNGSPSFIRVFLETKKGKVKSWNVLIAIIKPTGFLLCNLSCPIEQYLQLYVIDWSNPTIR